MAIKKSHNDPLGIIMGRDHPRYHPHSDRSVSPACTLTITLLDSNVEIRLQDSCALPAMARFSVRSDSRILLGHLQRHRHDYSAEGWKSQGVLGFPLDFLHASIISKIPIIFKACSCLPLCYNISYKRSWVPRLPYSHAKCFRRISL